MSENPVNYKYTKDHEWLSVDGSTATIGITDHAQHSLGDVVYVELPKIGTSFQATEPFGSVESVKAVSEIFTPVAGTVTEINKSLEDGPEIVNTDPYNDGWMIKIKLDNNPQLGSLLTAAEYEEFIAGEAGEDS
ncbi:MAG: glycine cleavage system protein GcvH [Pyrinomonadaceae bacterium]